MNDYRVLDLFSGIGGFALGLERAGMETVAFCEQDGYARRVLRRHWPDVWLYEDVRTLTAKRLKADGLKPNIICGGFPCQDISTAGKGAGLDGARSGLWSEMLRLVKEVRPRWVVAENVPALRSRGADRVLADLEGAGYSVRPVVVGAWAVGGQHQRERVWVVADRREVGLGRLLEGRPLPRAGLAGAAPVADAGGIRFDVMPDEREPGTMAGAAGGKGGTGHQPAIRLGHRGQDVADAPGPGHDHGPRGRLPVVRSRGDVRRWQEAVSRVRRVSDGIPSRVDRLRTLGNAVVPLIPELIGRAIIDIDAAALPARAAS